MFVRRIALMVWVAIFVVTGTLACSAVQADAQVATSGIGTRVESNEERLYRLWPTWTDQERFEFQWWAASQEPVNWERLRQLEDYVWAAYLADIHGREEAKPFDTSWWGAAANCVINHENSSRRANIYYGGKPWRSQRISDAAGFFQFLSTTWNGYGGYPTAALAPPLVQLDKFYEVWNNGRGRSHWAGSGC